MPRAEPTAVGGDQVLERNLEAEGGPEVFAGLRTLEARLAIEEGDYLLKGRYRATSEGRMRIDVFAGGERVYSEGLDETGAWEWQGGDAVPVDVGKAAAGPLRRGIELKFFPLARLSERGHSVAYEGRETVDGVDHHVFKVTFDDGFETWRYVHPETSLVERARDVRAFHPALDPTERPIETLFELWAEADGVRYAARTRNVDLETGEILSAGRVLEMRYNVPVEELDLGRDFVP